MYKHIGRDLQQLIGTSYKIYMMIKNKVTVIDIYYELL